MKLEWTFIDSTLFIFNKLLSPSFISSFCSDKISSSSSLLSFLSTFSSILFVKFGSSFEFDDLEDLDEDTEIFFSSFSSFSFICFILVPKFSFVTFSFIFASKSLFFLLWESFEKLCII